LRAKIDTPVHFLMETPERILQSAESIFMRMGIRSVSMDDVAAQLGMSKKTLYQYFEDKDQLVTTVVTRHFKQKCLELEACSNQANNAVHEFFLILDRIIIDFTSMHPIVIHDMQKFHPLAYAAFTRYKQEFVLACVRQNIERGKQEGHYRTDLDTDIISKYRLESIMIPFNMSVFPPEHYTLVSTAKLISENFIYGLVTPQGRALVEQYINERRK
jgi:TetR/AcrR family transcriptional regulator, cholesterol catabolism regulator